MKKREIPRHVGDFRFLHLDIWGLLFMFFPMVLLIISIVKFADKIVYVGIANTLIFTVSFLIVAEFPNRERGIDIFIDFLRYKYLGDRSMKKKVTSNEKGEV